MATAKSQDKYQEFLSGLKTEIQTEQMKFVLSANSQMLRLFWWIGHAILRYRKTEGWGTKIIQRLSVDLKKAFPDFKGNSERNLKYMRAFALAYPVGLDVKSGKISWYHHVTLLDKVKGEKLRRFYMEKVIENGWSRDTLVHQISSDLHLRQGKMQHNFAKTMPAGKSELVEVFFKDPYIFDFFELPQEAIERELEAALVNHIYRFLLEMGDGFAFLGRQVQLEKGGQNYYLDLLFYHTKLHCHVIMELKTGEFKPEYVGKMNFYLSAFDEDYRSVEDGPAIGIILCKSKNKVTAEYALRDVNNPIGIAVYNLTDAMPGNLEIPYITTDAN
ncbi:PDDEXK nuclease domain-containing protein [Pedobacter steynii]|uniref:DUF1016 domain-containing protein n=1 Tax=Pedobacter steynii TaxID=430522 RepID=A0A1D7QFF9_9SPHI|nr:PDDEXK nuclease domain-containing protein [Pedobacter steynii]AOM77401.1 hypothetical protein BFS30_09615 [Pedobacter steynii]